MDATDLGVRYVTRDGSNQNDGWLWESAFRSIAAAVASLPMIGSGGNARHGGKVYIGAGTFDETEPIEYNANLEIVGSGTGGDGAGNSQGGTVIRRNHDGPLFAPSETYKNWGHHLRLRSLMLHGNKANYSATADLVELQRGGFNTAFYDVLFAQSSGYGLRITDAISNCYLYNCSGASCDAGWIFANLGRATNLANLGIFGAQVDNCGPAVIHIEDDASGDVNNVMVYGLEAESHDGSHDYIIRVDTIGGAGPTYVTADGISAWRQDGNGIAVCARTGPGGGAPRWAMRNIHGSGYGRAFLDTHLDIGSIGTKPNHITQAVFPAGESEIGAI